MKKYEVYLGDINWTRVNYSSTKGFVTSDVKLMKPISYKELPQIRDEITWYLVSNDYANEIERLNNIIREALNYIDDNIYYKDHKAHINIDDVYTILKGVDK